jgi:hypothetical protein
MVHVRKLRDVAAVALATVILVAIVAACPAWTDDASALSDRPDTVQIKGDLSDILTDPRFDEGGGSGLWLIRLIERVLTPVLEALDTIFGSQVRSLLEHSPVLYWTVVAALVVLALAIVAHLFVMVAGAFGQSPAESIETAPSIGGRPLPEDLLGAAREAAQRRQYARAVVLLYVATLRELDRRDQLSFSNSETNRRMVRQIEDPDLRGRLMEITGTVDGIIYGNRPARRRTYERMAEIAAGAGVS